MKLAVLVALTFTSLAVPAEGQSPFREVRIPQTRVVDSGGDGDFLDLPEAIAAASSGDVLLVRTSPFVTYSTFTIDGKGLTIIGELPGGPGLGQPVFAGCTVRNLPAGEELVLRNLTFRGGPVGFALDGEAALLVENMDGTVWIEDCYFDVYSEDSNGLASLAIDDSTAVVLTRTTVLSATRAIITRGDPFVALGVTSSSVHAYECLFEGTQISITGFDIAPGDGGIAARLEDSSFFASGCTFQGGQGSIGTCVPSGVFCDLNPGNGGNGLEVLGASVAQTLDCTFIGGPAGISAVCGGDPCALGLAGVGTVGAIEEIPLPARTFKAEAPVNEPFADLTIEGEPGELALLVTSNGARVESAPLFFGAVLNTEPFTYEMLGTIPPSGTLETTWMVPPRTLLPSFRRVFQQVVLIDGMANSYLTSGSVLVLTP